MKKFDIYILVCSLFNVYSQIAQSNRKYWVTNAELLFFVPVPLHLFKHLLSHDLKPANACFTKGSILLSPKHMEVPCPVENLTDVRWREQRASVLAPRRPAPSACHTWSHSRHVAKEGRKPAIRGSSSLLLFPVLENHKLIYLQNVSKIKWAKEMR